MEALVDGVAGALAGPPAAASLSITVGAGGLGGAAGCCTGAAVSAPVCGEALGEGAAGGGGFTPAQPAVRRTKSSPTMSAARVNGSSARISFIGFSRVTFYDTPHCLNTVTSSALLNAVLWRTSLIVLGPAFPVPSTLYEGRRTSRVPSAAPRTQ